MVVKVSKRASRMKGSEIREILAIAEKLKDDPNFISLAGGLPAEETFPSLDVYLQRAEKEFGKRIYQYSPTKGIIELREFLAEEFLPKYLGFRPSVEEVMITTASQQAIMLAVETFVDENDIVVVENPTYLGVMDPLRNVGALIEGIKLENDGPNLSSLENILSRNRIKMFYTCPTFQNPAGITMSEEKRKQLVKLADKYDFLIFEDDPYRFIAFEDVPKPIAAYDRNNVIYTMSFSKSAVPGLRLAFVVARTEIVDKLAKVKQSYDLHTSTTNQFMLLEYLTSDFDEGIKMRKELYEARRDAMLEALEEFEAAKYTQPKGGFFVWLTFDKNVNTYEYYREVVRKEKVAYVPGKPFCVDGGERSMRLCYSTVSEERIREGIKRLAAFFNKL